MAHFNVLNDQAFHMLQCKVESGSLLGGVAPPNTIKSFMLFLSVLQIFFTVCCTSLIELIHTAGLLHGPGL